MKGWELMLEGRNDGEDRNTAHGIIIAALCFMSPECIILSGVKYKIFFSLLWWVYVHE